MINVLLLFVFATLFVAVGSGAFHALGTPWVLWSGPGLLQFLVQTLLVAAVQVYLGVRQTRQRLETLPSEIEPRPELLSLRSMIVMAGVGLLITLIATYVILRSLYGPTPEIRITVNWDGMAAGALLLLLGVFIWGVPLAGNIEHPLPRVRIITKLEQPSIEAGEAETQEASDEAQEVRGWLVSHTGSCWHLFVGVNRLDSIPDDRVAVAHVDERPPPSATS